MAVVEMDSGRFATEFSKEPAARLPYLALRAMNLVSRGNAVATAGVGFLRPACAWRDSPHQRLLLIKLFS
jgi:hypothetical protein